MRIFVTKVPLPLVASESTQNNVFVLTDVQEETAKRTWKEMGCMDKM
jgi:hypothetical protein